MKQILLLISAIVVFASGNLEKSITENFKSHAFKVTMN